MDKTDLDYTKELAKINLETLFSLADNLYSENRRLHHENQLLQIELSALRTDYEDALSNLHSYKKE